MTDTPKPPATTRAKRTPPPVARVVIGYKTKLKDGEATPTPEFRAPAHIKDKGRVDAYLAEQRALFLAKAKNLPYSGILDDVFLVETATQRVLQYTSAPDKKPVSERVLNFLVKTFPEEWDRESFDTHKRPKVLFIGFEIKTFLQILGAECTMPHTERRAPLGFWYKNKHCRDIGKAAMVGESLPLPYILARRRPIDLALAKKWDDLTLDWEGPGNNAQRDAYIACELAAQLGLLPPKPKDA